MLGSVSRKRHCLTSDVVLVVTTITNDLGFLERIVPNDQLQTWLPQVGVVGRTVSPLVRSVLRSYCGFGESSR